MPTEQVRKPHADLEAAVLSSLQEVAENAGNLHEAQRTILDTLQDVLEAERTLAVARNQQRTLSAEQQQRVQEIRERLEMASEGPWEWDGCSVTNWKDHTFTMEWISNRSDDKAQERADGSFIAASRADVAWLLGLVEGRHA